jgi:prophage maintenance system killer protein
LVFLDLNGIEMAIDDDTLAEHVLAVARGQVAKTDVAAFLRSHAAG